MEKWFSCSAVIATWSIAAGIAILEIVLPLMARVTDAMELASRIG